MLKSQQRIENAILLARLGINNRLSCSSNIPTFVSEVLQTSTVSSSIVSFSAFLLISYLIAIAIEVTASVGIKTCLTCRVLSVFKILKYVNHHRPCTDVAPSFANYSELPSDHVFL